MENDQTISGEKDFEGAFRRAIWPFLVIGQFYGVMPMVGVSSRPLADLHFKWKTFGAIHAVINAFTLSGYSLFSLWKTFKDASYFNMGEWQRKCATWLRTHKKVQFFLCKRLTKKDWKVEYEFLNSSAKTKHTNQNTRKMKHVWRFEWCLTVFPCMLIFFLLLLCDTFLRAQWKCSAVSILTHSYRSGIKQRL